MSQPAISVRNLTKQYLIGASRERHDTLRSELTSRFTSLFRNGSERAAQQPFWALRDVSFDIMPGEVVGVIGRNGAGKSTLLKLLSRITEPTSGRAEIRGRVGSLLEVGTGFDRELTGRENIYLSGAILGMREREITRKFDEIVAFAEVEKFIDTPVKHYSSGMYVRLAFGVAAHLETDVLILDEVLAVGDARFQARCLGKMHETATGGRTILFVSHNMAAVSRFCPRCIWLDQGKLRAFDDSRRVISEYLTSGGNDTGSVEYPDGSGPGSEFVRLLAVRMQGADGKSTASVAGNETFAIEIEYEALRATNGLRIGATVSTSDGTVVLATKDLDGLPEDYQRAAGRYVSKVDLPANFLNYGHYFVSVGADFPMIQAHFSVDGVLSFRVEPIGGVGGHIPDNRVGLLRVNLPWAVRRLDAS